MLLDVGAAASRTCCSSCTSEKVQLYENGEVLVVRPGPIGLHIAQPVGDNNEENEGVLVVTADARELRQLEGCLLYTSPSPRDRG